MLYLLSLIFFVNNIYNELSHVLHGTLFIGYFTILHFIPMASTIENIIPLLILGGIPIIFGIMGIIFGLLMMKRNYSSQSKRHGKIIVTIAILTNSINLTLVWLTS